MIPISLSLIGPKLRNHQNLLNKQVVSNGSNKSCKVEFPNLYELDYNNIYWQRMATPNATFYLYGAYFDDRWRGGPLAMVRILAMIDRISPPPTNCQLWFDPNICANHISGHICVRMV